LEGEAKAQSYVLSRIQAVLFRMFNWSVVLNGERNLNFLDFVDYIMDESLMLDVFVFFPSVHG